MIVVGNKKIMINLHILQMQIFHELPWQPFFNNPCNFVKKEQKNICIQ